MLRAAGFTKDGPRYNQRLPPMCYSGTAVANADSSAKETVRADAEPAASDTAVAQTDTNKSPRHFFCLRSDYLPSHPISKRPRTSISYPSCVQQFHGTR